MSRSMNASAHPSVLTETSVCCFKIAAKAIRRAQQIALKEDLRHGLKPVIAQAKQKPCR